MAHFDVFCLEKIEDFIKRNLTHLGVDPGLPEDMHRAVLEAEGIMVDASGAGWTILRRTCRCDRTMDCAHWFVHAQLGKKDILNRGMNREYEDVLTVDPAPRRPQIVVPDLSYAGVSR